jgi:protein-L-isoaspartate(D-aspartate) O-methyltransferase
MGEVEQFSFHNEARTPGFPRVLDAMRRVDRKDFLDDIFFGSWLFDMDYSWEVERDLKSLVELASNPQEGGLEEAFRAFNDKFVELVRRRTVGVRWNQREQAYLNQGVMLMEHYGCTSPWAVAFMLDQLRLEPGMNVLEIGTGCGYNAAVTSSLIEPDGRLVTVERIPKLIGIGKRHLVGHFGEQGYRQRFRLVCGDGSMGYSTGAPYDRIYLTAGVDRTRFDESCFAAQLNPGHGILLFPETGSLQKAGAFIVKEYRQGELIDEKSFEGITWSALVGKNA